jgi:signal peptidase I
MVQIEGPATEPEREPARAHLSGPLKHRPERYRRRSGRSASGLGWSWMRTALAVPVWAAFGFGAALLLAISALNVTSYRSMVDLSGSMSPAIGTGDLVVDRQISPLQARIGDVVTFRDPTDPKRLITHRLRQVSRTASVVAMVTKGDASNSAERWDIRTDGRIGKVVLKVPKLGYFVFWARSRFGAFGFIVIPSILLGGSLIIWIWRPRRRDKVRERAP